MKSLDVLAAVFGEAGLLSRSVYALVGLAGIFQAAQFRAIQQRWQTSSVYSS